MRRIMMFLRSPLGLLVLGLLAIWLYSRYRSGAQSVNPQFGQQRFGLDDDAIAATHQPVVHTQVGQTVDSGDL